MNKPQNFHQPVLVEEVLDLLHVTPGEKYIDATLGGGGHATEIVKRQGLLLGIDQDEEAIINARKRLQSVCPPPQKVSRTKPNLSEETQPFLLVRDNFSHLSEIATAHNFSQVSGILFDLGASTYQLTSPTRGFSFLQDAPLDMRMDKRLQVTAKDLINGLGRKELYELFTNLAQERFARPIADAIVSARRQKPIETTKELSTLIEKIYRVRGKLHPATKVFQALRMAVNLERDSLSQALPQAVELLKPTGRLVIISFHEGEDRIAKNFIKNQPNLKILTKKPITPGQTELQNNPNSRSAKLRVAEKL